MTGSGSGRYDHPMSDSYTPDQARTEFIAQEFSETLTKVIAEKASLRVTVLQQQKHIEALVARVSELEASAVVAETGPRDDDEADPALAE